MSSLYLNLWANIFQRNHNSNSLQWYLKCLKNSASQKLQILSPYNQYGTPLRVGKVICAVKPHSAGQWPKQLPFAFFIAMVKGNTSMSVSARIIYHFWKNTGSRICKNSEYRQP